MARPPLRQQHAEETRFAIVRAARKLFVKKGYHGSPVEEIARQARVTTGAVFHHFPTKRDIMVSVFEQVDTEIIEAIVAVCSPIESPLERFSTGNRIFLEMCMDREIAAIALREAPIALGYEKWKELDEAFSLDLIQSSIQALVDANIIRAIDLDLLAPIMLSALMEAGSRVAASENPKRTVEDAVAAFEQMVLGFS